MRAEMAGTRSRSQPRSVVMSSWSDLPDLPLTPAGLLSAAFLSLDIRDLRAAGRHLHSLPYGRTADRADFAAVLREGKGTCSTKHALLAALAREQGVALALTLGIYLMHEANTPGVGPVLEKHGLPWLPEAHCYLTYEGRRIDVTRSGVEPSEPIDALLHEEVIAPEQIGDYKVAVHQRYLRRWMSEHPEIVGQRRFDDLWRAREECIAALAR